MLEVNKVKHRSFVKDSISVLRSNMTGLFFKILTGVVVARALGPEGKGLIAFLMVFPGLAINIADLGVRQATVYFTGNNKYETASVVRAASGLYLIAVTCCVLAAGSLLLWNRTEAITLPMIALCLCMIPLSLFQSYSRGLMLGEQQIGSYNRFLWIPIVLTTFFTVILVWFLDLGVLGALLAPLLSLLPIVCLGAYLITRRYSLVPSWDLVLMRGIFSLGILFSVTIFVRSLGQRIPVLMLEEFSLFQQVGIFSVGLAFSELLSQAPKAAGVMVFARSVRAEDRAAFSLRVVSLFRVCVLVGLVCGVPLFYVCGFAIELLYGESFVASAKVVQIMLPGVIAMSAYRVLNMDFAGRGRPLFSLWVCLFAIIINLLICYFLKEQFDAVKAAIALSASNVISVIGITVIYSYYTDIPLSHFLRYRWEDFDFIRKITKKFV